MFYTVKEALKNFDCLENTKLIAGESGLDNQIKWVNIMEVPQVAKWMKGGEFLLTAAYAIKENPDIINTLIKDLVDKNVACLGIKLGQYLDEIPSKIIEDANEYGLPIIEIPKNKPYIDIMVPLTEKIISKQIVLMKNEKQIHSKMMNILLNDSGIDSICKSLSDLINLPVVILDSALNEFCIQNGYINLKKLKFRLKEILPSKPIFNKIYHFKESNIFKYAGAYVPIPFNNEIGGYLVVIEKKRLTPQQIAAVESASLVTAIELSKREAIRKKEEQIKGEIIDDLIIGSYHSADSIKNRLNYFGFNDTSEIFICVLQINNFNNQYSSKEYIKNEIKNIFSDVFIKKNISSLMQFKGTRLTIVVQIDLNLINIKELFSKLIKKIKNNIKVDFNVGISEETTDITAISNIYQQALDALRLGTNINNNIIYFNELGPYSFLWEIKDNKNIKDFYYDTIYKIIKYDKNQNTELFDSLKVYFHSNFNITKAAKKLYIHRNTLSYRLTRIEEITGLSLENYKELFHLQFGVYISKLYNEKEN